MQANGTFRVGSSTAAEFCAADSMPRNAQRVSAILEPIPCNRPSPCGFQAAAKVAGLNQNQPMIESRPTGMMTPQTGTEPMPPGQIRPPKFATVVSHNSAITPMQVATGVDESQGMNA